MTNEEIINQFQTDVLPEKYYAETTITTTKTTTTTTAAESGPLKSSSSTPYPLKELMAKTMPGDNIDNIDTILDTESGFDDSYTNPKSWFEDSSAGTTTTTAAP